MQVVYAGEGFPIRQGKALFLVGPTPRAKHPVPSWRPAALELARAAGFDTVFVPEPRDGIWPSTYEGQLAWETEGLERADVICAWVPRDMATMPALTTNVEFGLWAHSGKLVLAAPPSAPSTRYLFSTAQRLGIPTAHSLAEAVRLSSDLAGPPSERNGVFCRVPLMIWRSSSFQDYYHSLLASGNTLVGVDIIWSFKVGQDVFAWMLRPSIEITSEGRTKSNEVVLGRPDLAVVAAFTDPSDPKVLLVREFRSAVRNPSGKVLELPGGSSFTAMDPAALALKELSEETNLVLRPDDLVPLAARQAASTILSHKVHLFMASLDVEQVRALPTPDAVLGNFDEDERTTLELMRVTDALSSPDLDWVNVGLISQAFSAWKKSL